MKYITYNQTFCDFVIITGMHGVIFQAQIPIKFWDQWLFYFGYNCRQYWSLINENFSITACSHNYRRFSSCAFCNFRWNGDNGRNFPYSFSLRLKINIQLMKTLQIQKLMCYPTCVTMAFFNWSCDWRSLIPDDHPTGTAFALGLSSISSYRDIVIDYTLNKSFMEWKRFRFPQVFLSAAADVVVEFVKKN